MLGDVGLALLALFSVGVNSCKFRVTGQFEAPNEPAMHCYRKNLLLLGAEGRATVRLRALVPHRPMESTPQLVMSVYLARRALARAFDVTICRRMSDFKNMRLLRESFVLHPSAGGE